MRMFLYDPNLGELAAELRKAIKSGRMSYLDAMEAMKTALRDSIKHKATVMDDTPPN